METAESWRMLFENWPESIPRKGIIVTKFQENIPFANYMVSGGILLVDRDKPDSLGGRQVMMAYETISAVKITEIIDLPRFQVMGFQPPV